VPPDATRKVPFLVNVLQPTSGGAQRNTGARAVATENQNKTFDSYRKYYLHGGWQRAFRERGLDRLPFVHR
jgi:hypothetical protein